MINGQSIVVPVAKIHIDTPYLQGTVEAWVMDKPICDLIVGRVPGVGEPRTEMITGVEAERVDGSIQEVVTQAVVTRGQYAKEQRHTLS